MTLIQDQWQRFFDEKYVDTHSTREGPQPRRQAGH